MTTKRMTTTMSMMNYSLLSIILYIAEILFQISVVISYPCNYTLFCQIYRCCCPSDITDNGFYDSWAR
jgi:hypothetical protein